MTRQSISAFSPVQGGLPLFCSAYDTNDVLVMRTVQGSRLPHPIPYQGSKRLLAMKILATVNGRRFRRLYEPFAGSAAITIAAAHAGIGAEYIIGDSLESLIAVWRMIISSPIALADAYESVWLAGTSNSVDHYNHVRDKFNLSKDPALLLYLLARCVKNSPRFNPDGGFNQSPDKRRLGMHPVKMRREIFGASLLLRDRSKVISADFEDTLSDASREDLIYLDPPYQGVSEGGDRRYHKGLNRDRLIATLTDLNRRGVPVLLSYDGRCGSKVYGTPLPDSLDLVRLELEAGRSTQATLLGRKDVTVESLYVSEALMAEKSP